MSLTAARPLTYAAVLQTYRQLLEQNPGRALVIDESNVAVLLDGHLAGCFLEGGKFSVDDAYDFDRSAFIEESGCWDGAGEQTRKAIECPVFLAL